MTINVKLKRWGNSIGAILPKDELRLRKLKPNDTVSIVIVRETDLRDIFGSLPRKGSGQDLKDLSRKGWE
jgi:antitoxin component of MazEF toxin-antitoxin module